MDRSRSIVGALLATSSVVAMIAADAGPAYACSTIGNSGLTNPINTTIPCASASNAIITGNVVNAGTISPGGSFGIMLNGGTLNGAIINSGTISVLNGSAAANGVWVHGAIVTGGISNSGSIMSSAVDILVDTSPSFGGGIANSGHLVSASITAIEVFTVSAFTGGITNSGTISAATAIGIEVFTVSTFSGGITNSGHIASESMGIQVLTVSTFSGGITNSGHIASESMGIQVSTVSAFTGGIINSGTITPSKTGIDVNTVSTFSGGITNSGTISSSLAGISVVTVRNFGGGITNSGTLSGAGSSGAIVVKTVSSFGGGITNTGHISFTGSGSSVAAIVVADVSIFSGGIRNAGTISAEFGAGVRVGITATGSQIAATTFAGGITNSGTINAHTGIVVVGGQTFSGGISNSGTISAAGAGIQIGKTSTNIIVPVTSFTGGITNSGTISGNVGILVVAASTFGGGISNAGTISSGGGAGIQIGLVTALGAIASVATFTGGITNSGAIHASGIGIDVLGVTSFSNGISNSGAITGSVGIVVSGGTAFAGAIANSGNITGTTAAIDVSAAPNAMTINEAAGTITGAIKLSPFADVVNVSGGTINGNIVGNNAGRAAGNQVNFALGSGTFTYGSAFSISGVNRINVNSGLVILDGTNSATNVAVNGGILEVGDLAHPGALLTATNGLTIGTGGTLAGHGTVASNIAIPSGATLAPGGSIGTLNVTGNLSLAAGSFYQIAVTAGGQNSKTVATGTATIAGGTVEVMEQPGVYPPSFKYTILTANGGVNGTFTNAVSDFAFLIPVLSYDADNAYLTLNRNPTFFQNQAQTFNQRAVGAALDASPLGSAIVEPVLFQTAAGARQAFDALSGEIHGSVQSVLIDDSLYVRQAILGRLRQAGYAHAPDVMGALGFDGPVTAAGPGENNALGYAPAPGFPVKALPAGVPAFGSDVTFWSQGVGAWGHIGGDGNAAEAQRNLAGFFSGFDARFGEFARIGLVGGYTNSSVSVDARSSSAGIDTAHLGGYAGASFGALNLRGGAAYGFHSIDTSRNIVFPGFFDSARARYDGGTGQVFGEVGYGVALGRFAAEPFAGLAWVHLQTGSFAETGGAAALNGAGNTDDVGYSTLGGRVATSYLLSNGMALIPRFSAAWQHAFDGIAPAAALAFQNTAAGFAISGVPLARDAALVETALDLRVNPHAKLGLSYSGELAGRLQDHSVKGNFTWNF
ncbi:autotransporter domain-containing protein [Bradyrhizobium sp.]|uniref:autotransporter domain-containing protein n=1 Tax=Bradyrhizobium sp. TaxID=376 RepID=UPI003C2987E9